MASELDTREEKLPKVEAFLLLLNFKYASFFSGGCRLKFADKTPKSFI